MATLRFCLLLFVALLPVAVAALENPDDPEYASHLVRGKPMGKVGIEEMGEIVIYENTLPAVKKVTVSSTFTDRRDKKDKEIEGDYDSCWLRAASPTPKDIKDYFAKAYEISHHSAVVVMSEWNCWAKGKLTFVDGMDAEWSVSIGGVAYLNLPDGRFGIFFCPSCSDLFTLWDLDDATLRRYGRDPEQSDTFGKKR